jgi:hypothetical protein
MTFEAPTSDMTIVDFPDTKMMRVWSEGTPPAGYAATCGTNKVVQRFCNRPCVDLLVMTRLAAALWPSLGSSSGAAVGGAFRVGLPT